MTLVAPGQTLSQAKRHLGKDSHVYLCVHGCMCIYMCGCECSSVCVCVRGLWRKEWKERDYRSVAIRLESDCSAVRNGGCEHDSQRKQQAVEPCTAGPCWPIY